MLCSQTRFKSFGKLHVFKRAKRFDLSAKHTGLKEVWTAAEPMSYEMKGCLS